MTLAKELQTFGYVIIENIYTTKAINEILEYISNNNLEKKFGVRYFLKKNEKLNRLIFTEKLKAIIHEISKNAFVVKSIYFDKPPNSNWIVNWHQDLTINVKGKTEEVGYENWRKTKERVVVQPPLEILETMFTIRIHLDNCTVENGALRVIPKSHLIGIIDNQRIIGDLNEKEKICEVGKGGILLMKPMILHSSKRAENKKNRRVIHIEFSSKQLAKGLSWLERYEVFE